MPEIPITQYVRPDGHKRQVFGTVSDDVFSLADGLEISTEVLTTGEVAIYAKLVGESDETEYMELATNGPGDNNPDIVLEKVIRVVAERKATNG